MDPALRSYTLRYSYDHVLAQTVLAVMNESDERWIWSTRELHKREELSAYPYGALLITILEMHHRGVLAITLPCGSGLDFSVRQRKEVIPNGSAESVGQALESTTGR